MSAWIEYNFDCIESKLLNNDKVSDTEITLNEAISNILTDIDMPPSAHNDCKIVLNLLQHQPTNIDKKLLEIIENNQIDFWVRHIILLYIDDYMKYTKENINYILTIIENENLELILCQDITQHLLEKCINKNEDFNERIINLLYDAITHKWFYNNDEDDKEQKEAEYDLFLSIESFSFDYIDKLITLTFTIEDDIFPISKSLQKLAKLSNDEFYVFNKIYNDFFDYLDQSIYLKYLNSSVIFHFYNEEKNVGHIMATSFYNPKKVFYIKNNKLCTIEDGKEIQTKRDIDDKLKKAIDEITEESQVDF